jgi:hypothetical protein
MRPLDLRMSIRDGIQLLEVAWYVALERDTSRLKPHACGSIVLKVEKG